jgi:hypothetical protein
MKEEFLHFVWKYGLFNKSRLFDNEGNQITVVNPGIYNRDSGPDFFNARIKAGSTEWAGNVEIHVKSSDFYSHGHHTDHAYDNVILHVVSINDTDVLDSSGRLLLTVEIETDENVYDKYSEMISNPRIIACQGSLRGIDRFFVRHWLLSVLVGRLKSKSEYVRSLLDETGNDWEETFYRMIMKYFGFRVNSEPFSRLASVLPFRIIKKHLDNRLQVEALLYGCGGMLDEGIFREAVKDTYFKELAREFRILASKYSLKPMHGWIWKFSRLRPVNFPTIRISQLAGMLTFTPGLFSRVIETADCDKLRSFFRVSASGYWNCHYAFGKEARAIPKKTGDVLEDILIINVIAPVIFSYGEVKSERLFTERAVSIIENTGPEDNSILREWKELGLEARDAIESQALIHLRNEYCCRRRCLECSIGARVIASGGSFTEDHRLLLDDEQQYVR